MSVVVTWTGRRVCALRDAFRDTQEKFAERLGFSVRTIAYWSAQPDKTPSKEACAVLDTQLAQAPDDVRERFAQLDDSSLSRAAAPIDVEPWELLDLLTCSSISPTVLHAMERKTYEYAVSYPSYGPDALLMPIKRMMSRLADSLRNPQRVEVRRRCVGLLGVLAGIGGNLNLDIGRRGRADGLFSVGRLASEEGEDEDLRAWVIAIQSIGPFFAGRPHEAVTLLEEAAALAQQRSSCRRRAWIGSMHARALAAAGEADASRRAIDEARELIDSVEEPPRGTDFCSPVWVEGVAGSCSLLLRDADEASKLLSQARERRPQSDIKGRAFLTFDLASCRVMDDEPEAASQLAGEAFATAKGAVVRPIIDRAMRLRAEMRPWDGSQAVADLDALIAEATAGNEEA